MLRDNLVFDLFQALSPRSLPQYVCNVQTGLPNSNMKGSFTLREEGWREGESKGSDFITYHNFKPFVYVYCSKKLDVDFIISVMSLSTPNFYSRSKKFIK